ncbi:MAG: DUF2012 domain-containing protein [Elusimicrobiota bacterium]|jgi:hypothetical protein
MKRLQTAIILSLFLAPPLFAANTTAFDVYVRTSSGVPVASAQVSAMKFSTGGPDATQTKIVYTDASGRAAFSGGSELEDYSNYDIFVSSQGFLPSLRDQYNDPTHPQLRAIPPLVAASTITLSSFTAVTIGEIDVAFTNATHSSLIFGSVKPALGSYVDPIAYGMTTSDGGGAGTLRIFNVPYSSANTLSADAFDPLLNKGLARTVDADLHIGAPLQGVVIDFNNSMPPITTANTAQQSGAAGDLSVDGVVMDTVTPNWHAIPWVGISLQGQYYDSVSNSTRTENRWTNADPNGRFRFYGLQSGVTYYANVYWGCSQETGMCYEGNNSTAAAANVFGQAPGINDFLFAGAVITQRIQLKSVPPSTGKIAVIVKNTAGEMIPRSGVNVWPDGNQWKSSLDCAGIYVSSPGMTNANAQATTGYALLSGLASGNYSLQVWTQFSSQGGTRFNDGPDGVSCWQNQSCNCGTDDYRLTISSWMGDNDISVYNSSGTAIYTNVSSITITVNVQSNNTGRVKGTLSFPGVVDLSNDPITITLQPKCEGTTYCPSIGNFANFSAASTGPVINYSINVASGSAYWMNVNSNYWGIVQNGGGNNTIDLASTTVATVDIKFARAGRLVGSLYKPDGSLYQPKQGESANINAEGSSVNSWSWAQVNQDGSFIVGGLLPGTFRIRANGWGTFSYATPNPQPMASITAGQDTYQDVNLVSGMLVKIQATLSALPPMTLVSCPPTAKDCPPETWEARFLPRGSILTTEKISKWLLNGSNDDTGAQYAPDPANAHCNSSIPSPGFCVPRVPAPAAYDFYLFRRGNFDDIGLIGNYPYFTLEVTSRNVVVDPLDTTTANLGTLFMSGSSVTVRRVDLTPNPSLASTGQAALKGQVTGQNILRQQDFDALGGSMDNFMKYIPVLTLYDSNNALKAAGVVVPYPGSFQDVVNCGGQSVTRNACFDISIASGDFTTFKSNFEGAPGGFGFEIRGIPPGTYTAVLTTPNYPPYQTSVTLPSAGSTTTLNVDLDSAVGFGASLTGVVQSTTSSGWLANASVSVEADAYTQRTVTTNSSGSYRLDGLPAGSYRIKVSAPGYAFGFLRKDVSASGTYTADFSLPAAGASITGTVYSQKVPFPQTQPGAQIVAYNDTLNQADPTVDLPLYKAVTSSSGFYKLDGLESGKTYKIFVKMPGKYVLNQSTLTPALGGNVPGIDFTLLSKPLDIEVFGRPASPYYEFMVLNPNDFQSGNAWIGNVPFALAQSTNVQSYFENLPDNKVLLKYPLASLTANTDYTMHIEAISKSGKTITKEIVFATNRKANAVQEIDDALLGDDSDDSQGRKGNQASLDASGSNPSSLTLPVGALIPASTAAVPSCQFTNTDVDASTVAALVAGVDASAFASGIYQVTLSSVNYTDKGIDITLAYDKTDSSLNDLALYHYDDTAKKWESVPGLQTLDPVKGTISARRLRSLASVLGLKAGHPLKAVSVNGTYVPSTFFRPAAVAGDSGAFAIMRPSLAGAAYTGTTVKVFNFPNPFNLSSKTPTLVNKLGGQQDVTTYGTIIKLELPSGISGHGTIRIYTLNGELVRELDMGDLTGGTYYYTEWDGKNKSGSKVANGVYYGIVSIPGVKAKDVTFKMAVIK